ncbi:hypothetical protein QV65_26190 [Rhodococcus erythropolis]|nr:hypothetical protein QV65_26190 [Rhodococcus erythropolis]
MVVTTPTGVSIVDIVDRLGMTFLSGGDTVDDARTVSRVTLHEGPELRKAARAPSCSAQDWPSRPTLPLQ